MPARDYLLLARYWEEEPWGAWRDNLHAALIAREVRRPYMKDQAKNLLGDFMLRSRFERQEEAAEASLGFIRFMKAIAVKVTSSGGRSRKARR